MAETLRILGQAQPAAATPVNLITVGAGKSQVVSTLVVANTSTSGTTFRVHARIAGAATGAANAIVFDVALAGSEVAALTLGITLAATDVLTVQSAAGTVTFTAFGTEVS